MASTNAEANANTLSWSQENIRNMCILAHVDHGKTTCADNLIASNGIISRQSAGKIRYMDSRSDEQERMITMKSSAIALRWTAPPSSPSGEPGPSYLVNLIDSPGHVDFTSEVSTAARLADGALVVVDVVEGVLSQTRAVLRQAWRDRVKTCLVLNKVDRLIVELELTPLEAYQRVARIIEQVNAVNQQLLSEDVMKEEEVPAESAQAQGIDLSAEAGDGGGAQNWELQYDDAVEDAWRYSPDKGNVAFASAAHGWSFRVDTFARLVAGKMGANPRMLQKALWGDWAYSAKTKSAVRRSPTDTKTKPMFVQFVLEQLWRVYDAAYRSIDLDQLSKMQNQIAAWKGLDLSKLSPGSAAVRELLSRWLPFAGPVLQMATEHLPSPVEASKSRLPVLCPRWFAAGSQFASIETQVDEGVMPEEPAPYAAISLHRSDKAGCTVAYLAKFLAVDLERLVLTGDTLIGDETVRFVGLCRIFAGTLMPNRHLFVSGDREAAEEERPRSLCARRIFRLMGRFLEEVPEAPAGNIVAVEFTDGEATAEENTEAEAELGVERYLTLCDVAEGPSFETPYSTQAYGIVRVSVEPHHVTDMNALARGLRLLHRADPSVTYEAMPTGENVVGCCGDEHLKRCITDLQKLYARDIQLRVSQPLVAVREAIAPNVSAERIDPKVSALWLPTWASHLIDASTEASSQWSGVDRPDDDASEPGTAAHQERMFMSKAGVMSVWTPSRQVCLRVSAVALPTAVVEWMDRHADELECVVHRQRPSPAFTGSATEASLDTCLSEIAKEFTNRMQTAADEEDPLASSLLGLELCSMSVSKGSRTVLVSAGASGLGMYTAGQSASSSSTAQVSNEAADEGKEAQVAVPSWARASVLTGFHRASVAGPLCEEPLRGVCYILQSCQFAAAEDAADAPQPLPVAIASEPYRLIKGQVIVAMKEACRCCLFRRAHSRICEAMLSLEVQCEESTLGKVYGVLGKRRVKVENEGLREGTSLFCISSFLPLADSFGLAHDLRSAASGQVSFQCAFSHWELSEEDPFQEASLTAEELEELGDAPMQPNHSRRLIDAIRKRKGLPTDEKVVLNATKQRTVTRMK